MFSSIMRVILGIVTFIAGLKSCKGTRLITNEKITSRSKENCAWKYLRY